MNLFKVILYKIFRSVVGYINVPEIITQAEIDRLKAEIKSMRPNSIINYGYKVYSQNDEDGIINEIFNRIGCKSNKFLEIGIGNGLENNSLYLLLQGWKGAWIDCNSKAIKEIQVKLSNLVHNNKLQLVCEYIDKNNIKKIINNLELKPNEIDLLSIDIDGNDYYLLNELHYLRPRLIVTEYNAKFPPSISYCMAYNPNHRWNRDDHFGMSLRYITEKMETWGYKLVTCNLIGTNAFYVREDLISEQFKEEFDVEVQYQKPRYYLSQYSSGHAPSFKTIQNLH